MEQIARDRGLRVFVSTPAYKRFPMLGFLLGFARRRRVRWFVNQYTTALARFHSARFHFIGHSNGTYLLADALQRYEAMRFDRVAFAGSVVRRGYPWDEVFDQGRVESLRNDMATDDWIVAVFPRFFEQFWEVTGFSLGDIGSGGVFGFQDNAARRDQVLLRGGHAAAIEPANHASLVRYVLGIDPRPVIDKGIELADEVSSSTKWLAAFSGLVWICLVSCPVVLVAGLAYVGYGVLLPMLAVGLVIWWLLNTL
jgi:pimeloyl-ACP methyl ester carboxylesterase